MRKSLIVVAVFSAVLFVPMVALAQVEPDPGCDPVEGQYEDDCENRTVIILPEDDPPVGTPDADGDTDDPDPSGDVLEADASVFDDAPRSVDPVDPAPAPVPASAPASASASATATASATAAASSASASPAASSEALPETGGMGLIGLAAGLAVVSGLLASRMIYRSE